MSILSFFRRKRPLARNNRRLRLEPLEGRQLLAIDLATISGIAFSDTNNNGTVNTGEALSGASVELFRDIGPAGFDAGDTSLGTVTTNAQGQYLFGSLTAGGLLAANTLTAGNYFVRQTPVNGNLPPAVVPVTISAANRLGTVVSTIDGFNQTTQSLAVTNAAPTNSQSVTAPETIGNEREVTITQSAGAAGSSIDINVANSGLLFLNSGLGITVNVNIQYDGAADAGAATLNATGLGGIDLTGGNTNTGLRIGTFGDQVGGNVVLRVHSSAGNFSTTTVNIPQQGAVEEFFVPFASFTLGGGTGANFASVGAIEVFINGVPSLDAQVTVISSQRPSTVAANLQNIPIDAQIVIKKSTNGSDADTTPGVFLAVGANATFTYTVTNPGNVSLATVVARDDNGTSGNLADDITLTFVGGDANSNSRLDVGETWTYSAPVHVVTAGQYTNIARVTGNPVDAAGVDLAGVTDPTDTDPSNHFGVNAAINVVKNTNGQDANTPPGPQLAVGSTATFTYIVTNTGNVTLGTVAVTDDNGTPGTPGDDLTATLTGGDTNGNGRLETTETWTFTATHVVTAGQYSNIGRVSAVALDNTNTAITGIQAVVDTDPSNHLGVSAGINVVKSVNGNNADTATGPFLIVGNNATFTYVVTNTGTTSLATVTLVDDNGTPANAADNFSPTLQSGDTNSNSRLDVGETWNYTATRPVVVGQYTNIGTVTGSPVDAAGVAIPGLANVNDTDPSNYFGVNATINLVKSTNSQNADTAPGPILAVGSTATFTYVVTNPGNVSLGTITIIDDAGTPANAADNFNPTFVSGDTNSNNRLDVGETWTYTGTRVVTAGQYTNIGTASGTPLDATGTAIAGLAQATDTDPSNHLGASAGINVVKSVNGNDANTVTGPTLAAGGNATFTYVVTNTGTVSLSTITLVDDNGTVANAADDFNPTFQSGDTNSNNRLDVGETWNFTATRTVITGQYSNLGRVTGLPVDSTGTAIPGLATVSDTDPANYFGATTGIRIVKSTNGQDANTATGPQLAVGATATFTYVVTNTGTTSLGSVVVTDDNGTPAVITDDFTATLSSGDTNSNGRLDVSETWNYTASRVVTAGQYTNIGRVSGTPVDSTGATIAGLTPPTASDPSNHFGFTSGINLQKRTNGVDTSTGTPPALAVGTVATFTYIVTNTGTVALSNIIVRDDNGTTAVTTDDLTPTLVSGDTDADGQLDTTETWTYTASRTVATGPYTNRATVQGTDPASTVRNAAASNSLTGQNPLSKRRFLASSGT